MNNKIQVIPFLKDGAALQVFVKCKLIRHKLEVYATNKETFSIRNGISFSKEVKCQEHT